MAYCSGVNTRRDRWMAAFEELMTTSDAPKCGAGDVPFQLEQDGAPRPPVPRPRARRAASPRRSIAAFASSARSYCYATRLSQPLRERLLRHAYRKAKRFALIARGPINRCTTRALNAALYVCIRSNSMPPSGDRHDRCACTDHATTILTQGAPPPRLMAVFRKE